jgi:tyrosyl-tRNA synthetase
MKTDSKLIAEFLNRGVERIYPSREVLEKALRSGTQLTFYGGFDASASSLHIGNAIQIAKLAQLQALGHKIIFLIGDFTGMIGDPSEKKSARQQLDRATVTANAKVYKKQASAWLSFSGRNPAVVAANSKIYDKMSVEAFIRLAANFTVQQMMVRDMFQERLKEEKPIYLHEFLYPLVQGYDSVALEVDGEVGGNDQTFNMLAGRDLCKSILGKEKFVIANKLLVDSQGKKMGKTEGNVVSLDASPEDMYGKIMTWPDSVLAAAFEICTQLSWEEVKEIQKRLENTSLNPRDFKMRLAREVTSIYHGKKKAALAEEAFVNTFQKGQAPDEIEAIKVKAINIVDILLEIKLASSKGEARRVIEQGGVKVDGKVIKDINQTISLDKDGVVIQKGKREFRKISKQ